jgi:hypothetical protein
MKKARYLYENLISIYQTTRCHLSGDNNDDLLLLISQWQLYFDNTMYDESLI